MRYTIRMLGTALVASILTVWILWPTVVAAQPDIVVAADADGKDTISVATDDAGGFAGKVVVTNVSDSAYTITARGSERISACSLKVDPPSVPAARSVAIELSSKKCSLMENGERAVIHFDGRSSTDISVTLTPAERNEAVSIKSLLPPFGVATVLAIFPLLFLWFILRNLKVQEKDGDGEPEYEVPRDGKAEPKMKSVALTTPIEGMPAGWTFKDSWASNLSVGTTLFIALFASQEALTALLGEAPKAALAQLLIVSGIAGLLVGIAPLVLKTIGTSVLPTVGGLISAAWITLSGVLGQLLSIARILKADELNTGSYSIGMLGDLLGLAFSGDILAILTLLLGSFLLFYGFWTLRALFGEAFKMPKAKPDPVPPSDELLFSAALAAAGNRNEAEILAALELAESAATKFKEESSTLSPYPSLQPYLRTSPGDDYRRPYRRTSPGDDYRLPSGIL
jgi:hypothetical protein